MSGFFASIALVFTIYFVELMLVEKSNRCTWQTLLLLILSVFIADGSWSYWNWISFSIASSLSEGDDGEYTLASYFCGAAFGFLCNAIFFYSVHNSIRYAIIRIIQNFSETLNDNDSGIEDGIWRCDVPFTLLIFGAYYGFGPFADAIVITTGAKENGMIALCNALGTLLGSILSFLLVYLPPLLIFDFEQLDTSKNQPEHVSSSIEMGSITSIIHKSNALNG